MEEYKCMVSKIVDLIVNDTNHIHKTELMTLLV